MSRVLGSLVEEACGRWLGELVRRVATDLFVHGAKPLQLIVRSTQLPRYQVVECLRALIKYNLVTFEPSVNEAVADYRLVPENVLLLLRYPRYLLQIKNKLGTEAELIIEETLQNGSISASQLIINIAKKYKDDKEKNITVPSLRDILVSLVTAGYLQPAPSPESTDVPADVPTFVDRPSNPPALPEIDVRALMQGMASGDMSEIKDEVYWRVNFDRFHQDFRDEIMTKAIGRRIDDNAGELMRHLLVLMYVRTGPWSPVSNPIPAVEIKDSCKRATSLYPLLAQYLDQYLKVIEDNSCGMVRRSGDAGGGQYTVELRTAAVRLVWEVIEYTVQERLGSHAVRIFRLIRSKKYIEEEDIQKYAMLPAKEAKQLTYRLMSEHFITVQPMRKTATAGGGMSKAVYLYHIDLHQTACTIQELVYRAIYNSLARASHESRQNRRLLEKQRRVDSIVHGMKMRREPQENIREMEDTVTPPEKAVLASIQKMLKQLSTAEIELDRTLFILQWYFKYKT